MHRGWVVGLLQGLVVLAAYAPPASPAPRPIASTARAAVLATVELERPVCETVVLRAAAEEELEAVARLQLDVFVPSLDPPPLLPMLTGIYEANQRSVRAGMRRRLCGDIATRITRGSDILVAAVPAACVSPLLAEGAYAEADERLLGTVDISSQEVELPTHSLSSGLYISHMAVDPAFRRCGLGRRLLEAAEVAARARGAEGGIYLHVERQNAGARALYEQAGFFRQPETAPFLSFTRALNVQHRDVLLYHKPLES